MGVVVNTARSESKDSLGMQSYQNIVGGTIKNKPKRVKGCEERGER